MKKLTCLLGLVIGLLLFSSSFAFAMASQIYFDATTVGVKRGEEFELPIKINTLNNAVSGVDVVLEYNPEYLEVLSIDNGNFFPLFGKHFEINNKKIFVTGFFTETKQTKTGEGLFAKLSLKALKNGATSLKFDCKDKSISDTNVINVSGNDLIVCSELKPINISVAGSNYIVAASGFGKILGTESGALTTPTLTLTPTAVSTTSGMMETGVFDNSAFLIILGIIFILLGGYLLVYSRRNFNYASYSYYPLDK